MVTKGSVLDQGWRDTRGGSDLFIEAFAVRTWGLAPSGTPLLFTREQVNPAMRIDTSRLNVCGYAAREGGWGPLPDAPSPLLADELHRVPSPFTEMDPTVLFDFAHDTTGRLWTVSQTYRRAMQRTTYVVTSHR
jgi:hypothetical protein